MTNSEIIDVLQYMRHDVLANSDRDIALVKAIKALSVDFSTLKPSDCDVIVVKIDVDSYTVKEMEIFYDTVRERISDTPVIFVPKDIDFTLERHRFYFGKCDKCVLKWLKQEVDPNDER